MGVSCDSDWSAVSSSWIAAVSDCRVWIVSESESSWDCWAGVGSVLDSSAVSSSWIAAVSDCRVWIIFWSKSSLVCWVGVSCCFCDGPKIFWVGRGDGVVVVVTGDDGP